LKYFKKYATTTWWQQIRVDPSNNRSLKTTELKSNRFQILEKNIFQKIITNETNIKFQKTTELKKQQISKNIIYQKTTN
jgi:hypothetical protein